MPLILPGIGDLTGNELPQYPKTLPRFDIIAHRSPPFSGFSRFYDEWHEGFARNREGIIDFACTRLWDKDELVYALR